MTNERRYFSVERATGGDPRHLVREDVPLEVRNAAANYVDDIGWRIAGELWRLLRSELNLAGEVHSHPNINLGYAVTHLKTCNWDVFLDSLSAIFYWLRLKYGLRAALQFRDAMNARLLRYYSAYTMNEDGLVVEPATAIADEIIGEVRAILMAPAFEGPDRQFQAAIEESRRRPSPNYEIVVAQAVNAVEGVARIVLAKKAITLGQAIDEIAKQQQLHASLRKSLEGLHGYASDAGGRHGLVGKPNADRAIANFCLHQSAAAIVLLADLYDLETVRA